MDLESFCGPKHEPAEMIIIKDTASKRSRGGGKTFLGRKLIKKFLRQE